MNNLTVKKYENFMTDKWTENPFASFYKVEISSIQNILEKCDIKQLCK